LFEVHLVDKLNRITERWKMMVADSVGNHTNIGNHSLIDTGPRTTKKTVGHGPADSAEAKLKLLETGQLIVIFRIILL
jgi:hypothetical protein